MAWTSDLVTVGFYQGRFYPGHLHLVNRTESILRTLVQQRDHLLYAGQSPGLQALVLRQIDAADGYGDLRVNVALLEFLSVVDRYWWSGWSDTKPIWR